ncbi:MAG: NADH-quinone oxidoreductase subunit H [Deltaproteobacteria bacterium]|nr:NADH-quinone oxidoreductase subunit H [Deltaproteobacteria bacterium]
MMDGIDYLLMAIKVVVVVMAFVSLVPVLVWLERRASALMQDRLGPNRTHVFGFKAFGIIQAVADVAKLLLKEDFVPAKADRLLYAIGPFMVLVPAVVVPIAIPFADSIRLGAREFSFQAANVDGGLLFVFAIASLGVYGLILSGWSSNNKFSMLGAMRSSAQMVSYEISMGLAVVGVLMLFGTYQGVSSFELNHLIRAQGETISIFGLFTLPKWGVFVQPLGFLLFLAASYAETNRLPFDMPEDESALVAGYHTEYGGMKFAVFFMSEYVAMVTASCLVVALFFGGWQVPWAPTDVLRANAPLVARILLAGAGVAAVGTGLLFWHLVTNEIYAYGISPAIRRMTDPIKKIGSIGIGLAGLAMLAAAAFAVPTSMSAQAGQIVAAIAQLGAFVMKLGFFLFLYIWVRWTLPRFRYDQVMRLGWKVMLPLALVNILVTGFVGLAF